MLKFRQKEYLEAMEAPSSSSSFGLRYYKKSVHAPAWRVIPTDCEKNTLGENAKILLLFTTTIFMQEFFVCC